MVLPMLTAVLREFVCCRRRGFTSTERFENWNQSFKNLPKMWWREVQWGCIREHKWFIASPRKDYVWLRSISYRRPMETRKLAGLDLADLLLTSRRRWSVNIEVWGALLVSHWQCKGEGNDLRMVGWPGLLTCQNNYGSQDHNGEPERRQHIVMARIHVQLRMNVMDVS
jgi:hypothetical protein